MKWIIILVVVIVLLIAIVYLIGYFLPVTHQAVHIVKLKHAPGMVWSVITDRKNFPAWRKGLKKVDVQDGKHWTEESGDGTISYEEESAVVNQIMVTRIANKDLPFGGSWTFELKPDEGGAQLTITENGEVYNPIFRFMSKYVFGHQATLHQYADDLSRKLNAN
jgi:uncharacterized membrane protein